MLVKNPGFTAVAVLSLALGIGANTTIFSFVNALLLRVPAVEAPGTLLEVWNRPTKGDGGPLGFMPLTYPDYAYYRDHNRSFSGFAAFSGDPVPVSWSRTGQGEIVQGLFVSGNFFEVLGVRPRLGRGFLADEEKPPTGRPVVVISHAFWRESLGSDPAILGKTLKLNGAEFTVVGVAPAAFTGILVGLEPDFWAPLTAESVLSHGGSMLESRQASWLFGIGRLKADVEPAIAHADLVVLSQQLQKAFPESNKEMEAATFPVALVPGPVRKYVAAFTGLLMVVVGMVLLIACANAANLLLAQATARRREMAIRVALGAGRGRLIRQTLTESILLAILGGVLGIALAQWAVPALMALKPASLPLRISVPLDWHVLGFTLLLSFQTGVIFGTAPAFKSKASNPVLALKDEVPAGGPRGSVLRSTLVVSQVATCLILLIGAGLCIRSLINAQSIDPGFDAQHVLAGGLNPGSLGYSEAQGRAFYARLLERATALPGVRAAAFAQYLPLTTTSMTLDISLPGRSSHSQQPDIVATADVGPGYFRTMGIPILQGREFTDQDGTAAPRGLVINEALARKYWPGETPLGRVLLMMGPEAGGERQPFEVIGVVATGKYRTLSEPGTPFMYRSLLQFYHGNATLIVHAAGDPAQLLGAVRREVQSLDPDAVLTNLVTLRQHMSLPLFPARTAGLLLAAFGLLGLLLAVVGLYGVISFAVSQRTREIGIRMALGAERRDVLKMVVRQGLVLTLMGIAVGLAGAFAGTRVLSSLLYGIHPTDPLTFTLVTLTLVGVAFLASYIPAHRATKVDPMVALRYE